MNIQEALNIFGLSGDLTKEDIKRAYKKASLKHHPDRNKDNPISSEIMKAINAAFDFLMDNLDKINQFQSANDDESYNYGEELERVLSELSALAGIVFEVIGNWVWISGDTKTHKETLKVMGCKWASQKKQWFFRPEEHKSRWNRKEHSIDEIREMYGSNGQHKARGRQSVESRA
ncbi:DnaJ domain-containing protein [Salmonella enterica]|nr:DnaJ domain-containing protein [Salmonella enterica]EEP3373021.1 DnaJ domain-containing protein [Salmonella enterica]EFP6579728.1 DnaJ domain-containing protein [Salmonella enterica]EGC7971011.1 DnaJ domain-containing protein [Salmonella enterica]EIV4461188.1 DnaJ domain-containing protein [Salmonella enterica]